MSATGIDWHGSARQPCPECARGDRDKALSVSCNDDGSRIAHCFRCGYVETLRAERSTARPGRPIAAPQAPQRRETLSDYGRELWSACSHVSGCARAYLEARGCVIPPSDGDLRWHPALRHPSGYVGPALVGLITHAVTREPMSLHRTWVQPNGRKADVQPARLLLKGHAKAEGVIRLWPDTCVTIGLLVAEGVETALTAAHDYRPAWACIDAGNLAALPVLAGIETLVIAADNDPAGIEAATACADRWALAGVEVLPLAPNIERADWNDARAAA